MKTAKPNSITEPTTLPMVPEIRPNQLYTLETARLTISAKRSCLAREIRLGRLRFTKRGGKIYILGAWLLEWLGPGQVRKRAAEES
jgi:hypothetical protein